MNASFRKRLAGGELLCGTIVTLPSPEIVEIFSQAGVDGLFVGPYDLSASMGKTGRTTDPAVVAAIARVTACAAKAGLPLGIFGADADAVPDYMADGYTLIAVGIDTLLIGRAAGEIVDALK